MVEEKKEVVDSMNADTTKVGEQAAAEEATKKTEENNTPAAGNVEQKQV